MNIDNLKNIEPSNRPKFGDPINSNTPRNISNIKDFNTSPTKSIREKFYDLLINTLIMIVLVIIVYLGSSNNPTGARYEGAARAAAHR